MLAGSFSECHTDGTAVVGQVELRASFRDRVIRLDGRARPTPDATWDEAWDFYNLFDWPATLQTRVDQASFDFAASPALEQTPGGAMFIAKAPALFACLYASSPAKYSDALSRASKATAFKRLSRASCAAATRMTGAPRPR